MIKQEPIVINNKSFTKTYSDSGYRIKQIETGALYDVAIDLADVSYTYAETDILTEQEVNQDGNN